MVLFAIVGELGCHSEDTKVLTPSGIKSWNEIKVGDTLYGIDEFGRIRETKVLKVWTYRYKGKMIHFKSKRYDFLVTPNHRMLFASQHDKRFRYVEARDIVEKRINGYFPVKFWHIGKNDDIIDLSEFINVRRQEKYKFRIEDFMKLLGFYVSEGYIQKHKGKKVRYPTIANEDRAEIIEDLLNRMGLKYGFYEGRKFMIFNSNLGYFFEKYCYTDSINRAPYKKLPEMVFDYSSEKLFPLFEGLMLGDGSLNHVYYTSSERLAFDVARLGLYLGFNPTIKVRDRRGKSHVWNGRIIEVKHPTYEISFSYDPTGWFTSCPDKSWNNHVNYEIVDYDGIVFSFTTDLGNYFTVRNGKISVSGNSGKTLSAVALTFRNWFAKGRKVYSNIPLYKIPYHFIESVEQLDMMRDGVVLADEMWTLINARRSLSKRNQLVASILLRSRKRELVYFFTTQVLNLIDRTVRTLLDFTAYPILKGGDPIRNIPYTFCKLFIYKGSQATPGALFRTLYYKTWLVYEMYDTNYEVTDIVFNETPQEWKIIFQESKDSKPIYFNTWEEAHEYAKKYWEEQFKKREILESLPFDDLLTKNILISTSDEEI